MKFSDKLHYLCYQHRVSYRDLAELTGRSKGTVGNWLAGTFVPVLTDAAKLAAFFNVTLDYLGRGEITEPEPQRLELSDDEAFVLRMLRDLKLHREQAVQGLAIAARLGEEPVGKATTYAAERGRQVLSQATARREGRLQPQTERTATTKSS